MRVFIFILLASVAISSSGLAETKKADRKSVFTPKTDHNFNGLDVSGKYQTAMQAVITIEDEKVLDDLLGARTNFKDRLKKQGEMR